MGACGNGGAQMIAQNALVLAGWPDCTGRWNERRCDRPRRAPRPAGRCGSPALADHAGDASQLGRSAVTPARNAAAVVCG